MRVKGYHYENGKITQPISEFFRYQFNQLLEKDKDVVTKALVDVYGERIRDVIRDIEDERPDISTRELVEIIEDGSTCRKSSYFREPNIQALAENIANKEQNKQQEILCVGCAHGPEPYQLGMQLMDKGVDFHIDGIDANTESIELVKQGKTRPGSFDNFFRNMASKDIITHDSGTNEYSLSSDLMQKMDFKQHDIISGPVEAEKKYSTTVCNNVLQHFPRHTRELILLNILQNLEDGGTLALEKNHREFYSKNEEEWLKPYYKWKKSLNKFGLTPIKIGDNEVTVFKYNEKNNPFRKNKYALRDKKLVKYNNPNNLSY